MKGYKWKNKILCLSNGIYLIFDCIIDTSLPYNSKCPSGSKYILSFSKSFPQSTI